MIITPLGAKITILDAPAHLEPGVIMITTMNNPGDTRRSEVYLDPDTQLELAKELLARHQI